jgi:hypothetical protein
MSLTAGSYQLHSGRQNGVAPFAVANLPHLTKHSNSECVAVSSGRTESLFGRGLFCGFRVHLGQLLLHRPTRHPVKGYAEAGEDSRGHPQHKKNAVHVSARTQGIGFVGVLAARAGLSFRRYQSAGGDHRYGHHYDSHQLLHNGNLQHRQPALNNHNTSTAMSS